MSHIFICYHHDDGDFAENLRTKVKAAGFATWMDDRLRAGEDWRAEIDRAIKEDAFALIVVMTPEAKASEYVTYEWACAWGAGVKVVPVLLKSTPLHPRLEALQYLDFTNRNARPWDKLIEELQQAANSHAPHTIRVPKDAPSLIKRAVQALDSLNPEDRKAGVENLVQMSHPVAYEALVEAVRHPMLDVRIHAALTLAQQFKDARAVPGLLDALHDKEAHVRYAAAIALKQIGDASVVQRLIEVLSDRERPQNMSERVCDVAAAALKHIGTPEALAAVRKWQLVEQRNLLDRLRSKDWAERRGAIKMLGDIGDASAVPDLLKVLHGDKEGYVREAAAEALESIGTPEALAAVEQWRRERGTG